MFPRSISLMGFSCTFLSSWVSLESSRDFLQVPVACTSSCLMMFLWQEVSMLVFLSWHSFFLLVGVVGVVLFLVDLPGVVDFFCSN